jgi:PAS domain S-box-containing protein
MGILQLWELAGLDRFFHATPTTTPDPRIVIVEINESDIKKTRQWPISDATLAELLQKIKMLQPRAIGLDLYRDLPVGEGAEALAAVLQSTPNLIGIQKVVPGADGSVVSPPPMLSQLDRVGFNDILLDIDGRVRRALLSVRLNSGKTMHSLPVRLALLYLEAKDIQLKAIDQPNSGFALGKATFVPLQEDAGGYVHADIGGYQILLNFRNHANCWSETCRPFQTIPIAEVLDNRVGKEIMRDRIVLVSSTAESVNDRFFIPFSESYFTAPMGVEIHAEIISQILGAAIDGQPLIKILPKPLEYAWILAWAIAGAAWGASRGGLRLLVGLVMTWVALILGSYTLFLLGWWLPVVPSALCLLGSTILVASYVRAKELQKLIRDRIIAESALRVSNEKFAKAFRASPDPISISDLHNGRFIEVNDSFLSTFGCDRDQITNGLMIESDIWVKTSERTQIHHALQTNGYIRNAEVCFSAQGGDQIKTVLFSGELLDLDGRLCLIAISKDITERKQAEIMRQAKDAAEAASQAKSQFIAHMSHELRTPLNAILGFTGLMSHDPTLKSENLEYLGIVNRSGKHLLELINNILEMSKIEAGQMTIQKQNFDLNQLLDSIWEMLHLKAKSKNLQLIFERDPELPRYIQTEETKLRQVLINLLANAIKFTKEGSVTLRIREVGKLSSLSTIGYPISTTLIFEVEDTGPGIPPSDLDTPLFEAFVQTEIGKKTNDSTGLGLSISKEIVQLLGGELTYSSTLGKGTIFRFDIQVDLIDQPIQTRLEKRAIALEPGQISYRILVVEDDLENRQVLVRILTGVGLQVREAINGLEAVKLWQSWQPHLIWMDIRMPELDGCEATQQIRAEEQKWKIANREAPLSTLSLTQLPVPISKTAIIALTAIAFAEERSQILAAGCDDIILKPFQEEEIFAKMSEHLGIRYIYAQSRDSGKLIEKETLSPEATLKLLAKMSSTWIDKLNIAATKADADLIAELLQQEPVLDLILGNTLLDWTDNYQFERIIDLTTQVRHE